MARSSLDSLLRPRSIAILGASTDVTRIGGRALRHLMESGFSGEIYPVNPGRDEVQGLKAYHGIEDIPSAVDAAVLALPAAAVLPAMEECARKRVSAAVIFSAGFAEIGGEGAHLQQRMLEIARASGMRILGPNCLGLYNLHANTFMSFSGVFDDVKGTAGRLGLVSQSGGYAGEVVKAAQGIGLNFGIWITTGNEVDIGMGEALLQLAESDDVDVVVGFIEGVRDPDAFFAALAAAHSRRKPIVVLKVGRTEEGARAAASHTASLAGADSVYDAVFQRYGVYRARCTEEMLDIAYAASRGRFAAGKRLVILTNSGGIGVQAADFATDEGLDIPPTSAAIQAEISRLSPNAATHNPVDLTGQVANDPPMFGRAVDIVVGSGDFDAAYLNVGLIAGIPFIKKPLLDGMAAAASRHATFPLAVTVSGPGDVVAQYEAAGYLCFAEPARAIKALAALATFRAAWARSLPSSAALAGLPRIEPGRPLHEAESKALISAVGIPSPPEYLVRNGAEALAAARAIGKPVAIKVVSADILHKTEVGGVALNVDPETAGERLDALATAVARNAPEAQIEGFLITPMLTSGVECIVGAHVDPVLGPFVLFGLGGIAVELLKDVTSRLAPVSEDEALEMIRSIKCFPLLDGFRGRPKADIPALARAIANVSRLAAANAATLRTIEINPLLALGEGEGVIALDAVIET